MEILLDFVYTETVLVTVENVQELLPAACLLQLKGRCFHRGDSQFEVDDLKDRRACSDFFFFFFALLRGEKSVLRFFGEPTRSVQLSGYP